MSYEIHQSMEEPLTWLTKHPTTPEHLRRNHMVACGHAPHVQDKILQRRQKNRTKL